MQNQLLGEDKSIIAVDPVVIYNQAELMAISLYQDKYAKFYLPNHKLFYFQDKTYRVLRCIFDVVEYDSEKIKELCEFSIEKSTYWALYERIEGLKQDPLLGDWHGPKGVILILLEVGRTL